MKYSKLVKLGLLVLGLCPPAGQAASDTTQTSDHQGTYTLVTVNGNKLPYPVSHEDGAPQVLSGAITLNADGTFTSVSSYKLPTGVISQQLNGTYTRDGSRLSLQWKGAGTTISTLEGNTFTIDNNEGLLLGYRM